MIRRIGQRTHIAGPVFNVSTIDMTAIVRIPVSTRYSDDNIESVVADTNEELRHKLEDILRDKNNVSPRLDSNYKKKKQNCGWSTLISKSSGMEDAKLHRCKV